MSIYLAVFVVVTYFIWIKCFHNRHRRTLQKSLKTVLEVPSLSEIKGDGIRALIITAHPDDECMFFAPTILQLVELDAIVHLLCLSEGNYYNQGAQRKQELFNSCAVLGIQHSRITIVDHKNLPDDPKAEWRVSLVSSIIVKHMRAHTFNMVLTFDGRGVSGHANHIAIYKTVSYLASTGQVPNGCVLLSLVTVGLLRKYTSFLELPLSCLLPSCLCCFSGAQGYRQATNAMLCHRTQLLWFRYLYIAFSRYMFTNTFQIIPQGPKNLKIY
ncbi:N-acetylglucosaminyl-phosphatidylinositol de-N-acetylase isoform X2 [Antennarius striatus]|uniref:N-acetylglucosaminyl-phosphatidylinositol de-N-acetylase isoform X2 n=1 Tax=Antennarius striatus TaxID=241820 RepID=UPI0035B40334